MIFRISYTLLVLGTVMIQNDFAGGQPIQGDVNMVEINEVHNSMSDFTKLNFDLENFRCLHHWKCAKY